MTSRLMIDFILVCLTALAVSTAARWLWPSLGVVAAVGAAIAIGLMFTLIEAVFLGIRHGLRPRV